MVDGGGRNREIQRLRAAQQGGQATERQAQRLDYLQQNRGAGRRPGPQTGGPLLNAMGPGGQEAIRTQQPYNGGRMSNGGVTMDGGPMPMDGGQAGQAGADAMAAYGQMKQQPYGGANMDGLQSNYQNAPRAANQGMQGAQGSSLTSDFQKQRAMQAQTGELRTQSVQAPGMLPPMPRPTPGGMQPQGPDYFRGEGMSGNQFNKPGYQAPQRDVQNDYFRGGGMGMDKFNKPGYTAPPREVQGNYFRGGGMGGRQFNRPRPVPKNIKTLPGVLAQPPR